MQKNRKKVEYRTQTAILRAMNTVLNYEVKNLETGVVVIDEEFLRAKEIVEKKGGLL